jgi:hypothetical protein
VTFFSELYILGETRSAKLNYKYSGSQIRTDDEFFIEVRKTRQTLIPSVKDAKKFGHCIFLNNF